MQSKETLDNLDNLYKKYGLTSDDVFAHKHYKIITRKGIDKIQAKAKISIEYVPVRVEPEFACIHAFGEMGEAKVQTFGSAKYGGKKWNRDRNRGKGGFDELGNTEQWYIAEMAEKRAMSRVVLKLTGFYELGVFGEDEASDFSKSVSEGKKEQRQKEETKGVDVTKQLDAQIKNSLFAQFKSGALEMNKDNANRYVKSNGYVEFTNDEYAKFEQTAKNNGVKA